MSQSATLDTKKEKEKKNWQQLKKGKDEGNEGRR